MKTINEWRKIFGIQCYDDDDGKSTLQAIRTEALDASIEAIKKRGGSWTYELGLEIAIEAIEELKEH